MSDDIDRGLREGWITLPTDNPQPTDGYELHVGKYWRSRFSGGGGGGGLHSGGGEGCGGAGVGANEG